MVVEVKKRRKVQVVVHLNTWCSDGYGSIGEHEMRSDRGRERVRKDRSQIISCSLDSFVLDILILIRILSVSQIWNAKGCNASNLLNSRNNYMASPIPSVPLLPRNEISRYFLLVAQIHFLPSMSLRNSTFLLCFQAL